MGNLLRNRYVAKIFTVFDHSEGLFISLWVGV